MSDASPAGFGPYQLKADSGAMLRLALGSSITIATLMCLPDGISLLPVAPNLVTWAIRLAGLWLTAFVIWFLGFLGILRLARSVSGPLVLDKSGVKLWRFGKTIPWQSIKALGTDEQALFAKAFWLRPPVLRLTIYAKKKEHKLSTHLVPSFTFSPQQFKSLIRHVSRQAFGLAPDAAHVLMFASGDEQDTLKKLGERSHKARFGLSIVIALGLVVFLGRRTVVNYNFNEGTRAFRQADYATARDRYLIAARTDPAFAAAWDQLARCEFRLGNPAAAEKYWLRALQMKPDMVEAKLGLSFLCIERRQFDQARALIEQSMRLNPVYAAAAARINLAQLYMNLGRTQDAIAVAQRLLKEEPDSARASCMLARGHLQLGEIEQARAVLGAVSESTVDPPSMPFLTLVKSELDFAFGNVDEAEQLLEPLVGKYGQTPDALIALARTRMAKARYTEAEKLLADATAANARNPWPLIVSAQLALMKGDRKQSTTLLTRALDLHDEDVRADAACAKLSVKLGLTQQAVELAKRALAVEPRTVDALYVMKSVQPGEQ